jgi:hypothetical protein
VLVEDVVMMGRYGHMNFLRMTRPADRTAVNEALERVGMTAFRKRQIGELSGGQKKRVFLARALAQEGQVILLDEPFTGVDVTTENQIIELLKDLRAEGRVMLVSTHNLGSVPEFCDRAVLINRSVLAEGPTGEVFTQKNLQKAFGGVLRHFVLGGRTCTMTTTGARSRFSPMMSGPSSSMARPSARPARASQRRAGRHPDELAARALFLWLHGQRHVGLGADRGNLRLPVVLPDAQGLVADRRCAVTLDRAGRSRRLHAGPAICSRRLSRRRAGGRRHAAIRSRTGCAKTRSSA